MILCQHPIIGSIVQPSKVPSADVGRAGGSGEGNYSGGGHPFPQETSDWWLAFSANESILGSFITMSIVHFAFHDCTLLCKLTIREWEV